jgi:fermentation-respiration switch protein FrsA (DUF1100 family)
MGHGFGAVRDQRLDAYAERFAAAGLAALVFDYRHFGDSSGEPRQLLDIGRQHEDWRSAISFARTLEGIDRTRIAVWGSSFGGGHVMAIAAEDHALAAAVSQVPFVDGLRTLPALGLRQALMLTAAGLRDQAQALLGRGPYMIPAAGPAGSRSVMNTPDTLSGMELLTPADSTWRNEVAARIALHVGSYRPARKASRITCPILFCIADHDQLTPPVYALNAAARAPRAELRRYPIGHFEIYVGEPFERAVSDQVEFLTRHLSGTSVEGTGVPEWAGRAREHLGAAQG